MINFFKKIFSIFFIFIFLTNTAFSNEYMNALFECKDAQSDHKAYFKMGELNGEKIINIVQSISFHFIEYCMYLIRKKKSEILGKNTEGTYPMIINIIVPSVD